MESDHGTDEALLVVEDVLREVVAGGRATIDVRHSPRAAGLLIEILPTNPSACPVSVLADSPPQIDLFLGPEPIRASLELWENDREQNLSRLREMVESIAEGRYEQRVVTLKRNRIKVTGRFSFATGEEMHSYSGTASTAVAPGEEQVRQFEPY